MNATGKILFGDIRCIICICLQRKSAEFVCVDRDVSSHAPSERECLKKKEKTSVFGDGCGNSSLRNDRKNIRNHTAPFRNRLR